VFFVQEGGKGDHVGRIEADEADSYFLGGEGYGRGNQKQEKAREKDHQGLLGQRGGWEKAFLYSRHLPRIRGFQVGRSKRQCQT